MLSVSRSRKRNRDIFLGTWNVRSLYRAGSLMPINWPCRMKMETDVRIYSHEHQVIVRNVNPNSVRAKRVALRFGVDGVLL
jgi:hypothetical protein